MEKDNPYEFASVMQNSLRLAFWAMFLYPPAMIALSIWVVHSWTIISTSLASSLTIGFVLCQTQGIDPRKWWFLWRGPVIVIRDDSNIAASKEWLDDVCPAGYKELMPGAFKFKYKPQALAFKLIYG